jgi:hypothetical protein
MDSIIADAAHSLPDAIDKEIVQEMITKYEKN